MELLDPNGLKAIAERLNGTIKVINDPDIAQSYGIHQADLIDAAFKDYFSLHLSDVKDVFVRCDEAVARIASCDFSIPIEVNQSTHVGNYVAHSLNVIMEELSSRVFPFQQEIIESVSDLVIVTNQKGLIQRFNKSFEEATGYNLEELKDKKVTNIFDPIVLNSSLSGGFTIKNLEVNIRNGRKKIPVILTVNEVKGFRNLTKGFIFIAQLKQKKVQSNK